VADYSLADTLVKNVHWGYQQGCSFATESCITGGSTAFPRFWCLSAESEICGLDRTGVRRCGLDQYISPLPSHISYFEQPQAGTLAQADYCPHYRIGISNRVCTDASSSYSPYSNVNFMREIMDKTSRCLDSTLHGSVPEYSAEPGDFAVAQPACFDIACTANQAAYVVRISDLKGSKVELGICTAADQVLSGSTLGLEGQVTCAAPAELCTDLTSKIFNPEAAGGLVSYAKNVQPLWCSAMWFAFLLRT
jgi:hypothetical protein